MSCLLMCVSILALASSVLELLVEPPALLWLLLPSSALVGCLCHGSKETDPSL